MKVPDKHDRSGIGQVELDMNGNKNLGSSQLTA